MSTTLAVPPQRRQVPNELTRAVRGTLVRFPAAAAAFIWMWDDGPPKVHIVIEDELAGTHACTREILACFPGATVSFEYWEQWRSQDGFGGYERVYLRHPRIARQQPAPADSGVLLVEALHQFLARLECVEAILVARRATGTRVWTVIRMLGRPDQDSIRARESQIVDCLENPRLTFSTMERGVMPLGRFLRRFMRIEEAVCVYRRN